MVNDKQVREMRRLRAEGRTLKRAAMLAGMDVKTARKYENQAELPSEMKRSRAYRTRRDAFCEVWPEIEEFLNDAPGLEALTMFQFLQEKYPAQFQDSQLRTLQRRFKVWRALKGRGPEVFFAQNYKPGEWSAADFTHMDELGITIEGRPFAHMIYHFVLPYSNWETGTICFSESFESLTLGFQNALWLLGGVTRYHRTDRLTAAVKRPGQQPGQFTARYSALLKHYEIEGKPTNAYSGNENGDVEQSHHRLKRRLEQQLLLRGSRNFSSREEYEKFLRKFFERQNRGRQVRLCEELQVLRGLPARRLEIFQTISLKVGKSSTLNVSNVTYSVPSRLIGERVEIRLHGDYLEILYAGQKVDEIPRQRQEKGYFIQYRHIIDWLVRKPGAFANYRYREDLFPSTNFRMAYDSLRDHHEDRVADKEYLKILHLAAQEGEEKVNEILARTDLTGRLDSALVKERLAAPEPPSIIDVSVGEASPEIYDNLLETGAVI